MLLSLKGTTPPAILALADGTVYVGNSIGAPGSTVGEVVFNTSMTGYQEILTDPSYCQQIVTLTYPHIGSYGVNPEDVESNKVHAAGLIIKDLPLVASNFRSTQTLTQYLVAEGTVAIANIDTRQLTRQLRTQGAQNGCIWALAVGESVTKEAVEKAVAAAKAAPNMSGLDLAKVVTSATSYGWTETEWMLSNKDGKPGYGQQTDPKFHVVAYDFGVKKNILRMLAERGCKVTVVPAGSDPSICAAVAVAVAVPWTKGLRTPLVLNCWPARTRRARERWSPTRWPGRRCWARRWRRTPWHCCSGFANRGRPSGRRPNWIAATNTDSTKDIKDAAITCDATDHQW